jgi:hypothetical protein
VCPCQRPSRFQAVSPCRARKSRIYVGRIARSIR